MLDIKCIKMGRGKDTYEVKGDIADYTYDEIADKCDYNNLGYYVCYATPEKVVIEVYTD